MSQESPRGVQPAGPVRAADLATTAAVVTIGAQMSGICQAQPGEHNVGDPDG